MSLRIGLVYDRFGDTPRPPGAPDDWDAEYEPEETVAALEDAIRQLGHTPVRIGNTEALLAWIQTGARLDAALSIAEGIGIGEGGTRNREAHAPVVFELAGIPHLFSDAHALSVSLDKHLTKVVAESVGVRTPRWSVLRPGSADDLAGAEALGFPLFVKPRYEGTARGIAPTSRVESASALCLEAARQHAIYRQDLLAEMFVAGAELTVGVVGTGAEARATPAILRAVETTTGIGLHALDQYDRPEAPLAYTVEGDLTPEVEAEAARAALAIHRALGLADVSRSDFRLDASGVVWFLEVNPLPTFAPNGTFAVLAELEGVPYADWLASVLSLAIARLGA